MLPAAMANTGQLRSFLTSSLGTIHSIPVTFHALLLSVVFFSAFLDEGLIYQVQGAETCPDYATKNITNITKAWSKPCVANFEYCIPPKGPVPAVCPGKLVYNPLRQRCDLRKTCKELGKETDRECLNKPCGMYGHLDCKKYFVCSGGTKIWKECPGDTVFDFELEVCKIEGKCKYPVTPIIPTELPEDGGLNIMDDSERVECEYHDFDEPSEFKDMDGGGGIELESPKVTDWGKWMPWAKCPEGQYITGLSIWKRSTEGPDGRFDHAGVISIGFRCENLLAKKKKDKTIGQCANGSPDNVWNFFLECERGAAVGFQLSQLEDQGKGPTADDVATDNFKLICSCGVNKELFKPYHEPLPKYEKVGGQMGEWTEKRFCKEKQALCAFRTQMEDWEKKQNVDLVKSDMTGLNQMKFRCCDVPPPTKSCEAKVTKKYLQVCDNLEGYVKRPCPFDTYVGTLYNAQNFSKAASFYTSIGFKLEDSLKDLETRLRAELPDCGKKKLCLQQWLKGEGADSRRMFTPAHKERSEVNVTAGIELQLFQTVVLCGMYEVHTNQVILEARSAREGKTKPEPELHLFEGSLTHYARKKRSMDKIIENEQVDDRLQVK